MDGQIRTAAIQPASAWRRFFDLVIDAIVFLAAGFVVSFVLGLLGLGRFLTESAAIRFVSSYALYFLYYFLFEATLQRTPAKFITGTKVVGTDGLKPTVGAIAARTLSRWVPFEAISIYTGKDEDKKRTWWHDRWTRTRVVRA